MPIIHVYSTEGWLSPAPKRLMIDKIADAVVEAERVQVVRQITAVLIHELPDGGWSFQASNFSSATTQRSFHRLLSISRRRNERARTAPAAVSGRRRALGEKLAGECHGNTVAQL